MLSGGDDSNNIIPLGMFFSLFVYIILWSFPLCLCPGELAHRLPLQEGNRLTEKSTNIVSPPPSKPTFSEVFQMECRDPLDFPTGMSGYAM